jgi:DNA helicase HerA-like ATPase
VLLAHKPNKLLVTGASGTGKTTYWLRYVLGAEARWKFVFDHEGEFTLRSRARPALSAPDLADSVRTGWTVFDPAVMFPGRMPEAWLFFCDWVFAASARLPGKKLIACDELQSYSDNQRAPIEMNTVLETGRRYGLDAAFVSQAPNLLHNRVGNQLTEIVTFRHVHPRPIEWLTGVGFHPDQVLALPPGSFIARNLNSGAESRGRVF